MKLHLPIALLAAVMSTVAYGEYSYVVTEEGDTTKTIFTGNGFSEYIESSDGSYKSAYNDPNVNYGTSSTGKRPTAGNIGGLKQGDKEGVNTEITVTGENTILWGVAGVGPGGYSASGNKNITITDGASAAQVWGLGYDARDYPDTAADTDKEINISVTNGGMVAQIIGTAFSRSDNKDISKKTTSEKVTITLDNGVAGKYKDASGTVQNFPGSEVILGAGQYGVSTNNEITINILNKSEVYGDVIAAGMTKNALDSYVNSTTINVEDSLVEGNLYGGGVYEKKNAATATFTIKENANINVTNSTVKGNIYGAGTVKHIVGGNTSIELGESTVDGYVYGAGAGSEVRGNSTVAIVGDNVNVKEIYGKVENGGKILGDSILSFDGTSDAAIDGYMAKAHGFNAVELKNKDTVNFDADRYAKFDSLYIADGNAGHTTVTSAGNREKFHRISIGKGGELSLGKGATYTVTGTEWGTYINDKGETVRPEGAEEAIIVNGALTVKDGAQLNMVGSGNQMMVGNGTLTVDNNSTVNLSTAQTLSMGYNAGESGTILVDNGSTLNGGSQNTWLGGGKVTVDHGSTMTACIGDGTTNNYRLLMGLSGNTTKLEVMNGSTFTSGASRMVTNYQTDTNVEITVDNATFTQLGTAKVSDTKTEDSITYICDRGINNYGKPIIDKDEYPHGLVSNVSTTFTAKNGGKIDIQSSKTYIGNAKDKELGYTDKSATFNVGKDSSISFQQLEVYAETKISFDDASGVFSATGVNLYDGAIMNIEKAGSVSLGEVVVGGGAELNVKGTTLVFTEPFTETAGITVATGGSLTLDNVALELVLNDATGNDFSSLVEFDYNILKGLTEDAALSFVESLNAGNVTIKGLVDGELVALNAGELTFSNEGGTVSISGSASIPEPTTATLSLLALAALAARRRRK